MVDLIEDVLAMRSVSLEKHGITVIREFQEVPAMLVDRHKIMQIIYNLVENAVHALRDPIHGGGRITIRLYQTQDDRLGVEVEDNGIGIKRENLSQIFNFGFSTKEDGHGFGLHTSALAAIEMGGKITVHSDGEGQGATFCLQLRQWQGARGKECVPTG